MNLFGFLFLWFKIKWSSEKGLCYQFQVPEKVTLLTATIVEQELKDVEGSKM